MEVGKRLRELREMRGLTVNKLANIAGLSQSFLREIELGNKNPTIESLSLFCDGLGISIAEFFSEDEPGINPILRTKLMDLDERQQIKLADFLDSLKGRDDGR